MKERSQCSHPDIRLLIWSRQKLYMFVGLIWFPNGALRYFWVSPGWLMVHPVSLSHCGIEGSTRGTIIDFTKLSLAPEASL